ncbi:amino acid--tRNA ligase-related protein [Patescibacteria group bacterium]
MKRISIKNSLENVGKKIKIYGWVESRRDMGKLIFADIIDATGVLQVVFPPKDKDLLKIASSLRTSDVVEMEGMVNKRPEGMINKELETGKIELSVTKLIILNKAETPPFELNTDGYEVNEELRLKYRYLDLRRRRLQNNLRIRHKANQFIRKYLTEQNFVEIETPILTKSTPEGARDFIVPSRLHKGKFYALPQSPQQYKQLLMVAGFEKYFQIVSCLRDEDSRSNRAYGEFTQLDLEMSFVEQNDILELMEEMFTQMIIELFPEKKMTKTPWPRIDYTQAMKKYGKDDPDIRKNKDDKNELGFAWIVNFPLFTEQSEDDFFHGSGKSKWAPSHHMFTAPHPDDVSLLDKDPSKVRGLQHDLVLNGSEVGGGSIRIHDPKIQEKIFDLIGFTAEQKEQFSHMLTAFKYGVPPHGGIAPGIDRLLTQILGEPSLREVIAFPKSGDGRDLMMDAPSEINENQLKELGISINKKEKKKN